MGEHPDDGYLRFRRGSVRLASAASLAAVVMMTAYVATTWADKPHRGGIVVLIGVVVLTVSVVELARAERLVETRWCDLFFGAWSSLYVVMIVILAWLDGGMGSPLAITFFPVLVFAGLCYPVRLAALIGLGCVAGYLMLGMASPDDHVGESLYVAGSLGLTAVMCSWQAWIFERQRRELAAASRTDHLTESLNRRGFHEHAGRILQRAARSGDPVSLVLIDLDGFKGVNDRHGHAAGDELLCWVVDALRAGSRPDDAVARLGGDEFALLLPGLHVGQATEVAERLREALAERVAASFGVAALDEADAGALLAAADGELYRDKSRRRGHLVPGPLALELPG